MFRNENQSLQCHAYSLELYNIPRNEQNRTIYREIYKQARIVFLGNSNNVHSHTCSFSSTNDFRDVCFSDIWLTSNDVLSYLRLILWFSSMTQFVLPNLLL